MKKSFFIALAIFFLVIFPFKNKIWAAQNEVHSQGWFFPGIGSGNGLWHLSIGAHFWKDHLDVRNLQFLADVDILPGLRWHAILRSNDTLNDLTRWSPRFDENFVEAYGFYTTTSSVLSLSGKLGRVRYLRFPYPDAIATFDQVPGVGDLVGEDETGYSGAILTADYAHKSGLGFHATWIDWGLGVDRPSDWAEKYIFYRNDFERWHFEARYGDLPVREEPLGQTERGVNLFVGRSFKNWSVGFLYEELDNQPAYTGIVVRFAQDDTTKKMGELAFDYTRTPRGHAVQVPLLSGTIGRVRRGDSAQEPVFRGLLQKTGEEGFLESTNCALVGEVQAERVRTYWQNGQVRNFYEHRLASWGDTMSSDLVVLMVEDPWYLNLESLVSPHADLWSWDDLKDWEKDRMGPAQLNQKVIYRFYRYKK